MIDLPSLAKFLSTLINSEISCGVKTAVGSSKIKYLHHDKVPLEFQLFAVGRR